MTKTRRLKALITVRDWCASYEGDPDDMADALEVLDQEIAELEKDVAIGQIVRTIRGEYTTPGAARASAIRRVAADPTLIGAALHAAGVR